MNISIHYLFLCFSLSDSFQKILSVAKMPHHRKKAERDKDEIAKDEGTLHV